MDSRCALIIRLSARARPVRGAPRHRTFRRYGRRATFFNLAAALVLMLTAGHAPAAEGPRILAFGDSLTAGFGLPPEQAFPARLEARLAALGVTADIINAGVSGDTTAGGLARIDWALGQKPDYVILALGANDALRGLDPKLTYANLDKILDRIAASGARTLLLGMLAPSNWGRDYQKTFDAIYPRLAAKHHVMLYPFFLEGVAMQASLNQPDGLHPNARGVEVLAKRIAPYVKRLIESAAPGSR